MAKYRRRPIFADAVQAGQPLSVSEAPGWLLAAILDGSIVALSDGGLKVELSCYHSVAAADDWVVREEDGDIYVIGAEDFIELFEPADG